jgi:tetratricopeptide (TPR) repeat protein
MIVKFRTITIERLILLFIFLYLSNSVFGEELIGKTWVMVFTERKDGSRVLDDVKPFTFKFGKDTCAFYVLQKTFITPYSYQNRLLTINNAKQYIVENLTDSSLVICELGYNGLTEDKINRYFLINENYIESYLLKTNKIERENDSILIANQFMSPQYDIIKLVDNLKIKNSNGYFNGDILISSIGEIKDINVLTNKDLSEKDIKAFKDAIFSTNGKWKMPKNNKKYYYRIKYMVQFSHSNGLDGFIVELHTLKPHKWPADQNNQRNKAIKEFNKATEFYTKGKLDQPKEYYSKAIELDSLYIDAYYNRAAVNFKLNILNEACKDWSYLKSLGQKEGENLYNEKCK